MDLLEGSTKVTPTLIAKQAPLFDNHVDEVVECSLASLEFVWLERGLRILAKRASMDGWCTKCNRQKWCREKGEWFALRAEATCHNFLLNSIQLSFSLFSILYLVSGIQYPPQTPPTYPESHVDFLQNASSKDNQLPLRYASWSRWLAKRKKHMGKV
jgi:hypothetical protein